MTNLLALPSETILDKDYKIRRVLGAGGFGITYLAEEIPLQRKVTIKEYFPSEYAARIDDVDAVPRSKDCAGDYKWGLDRFIEEAQTLAKFEHPNIVRVFRYFRANKTGYMVLQFEEGVSLRNWLKELKRAPRQAELDLLLEPLLSALELIHKSDYLHRDIAPDNVIVRKDKSPVLIDFGSARGEIAHQSRTVSALVKPGYSPYEQYSSTTSNQGPWTDIYALGATLYQAVTGKRPPDAPARIVKDDYVSARDAAVGSYRPGFLAAIDHALRLDPKARPKSIAEWRGPLLAPGEKPAVKMRGTLGFGLRKQSTPEPIAAPPVVMTAAAPRRPPPVAPPAHMIGSIESVQQKLAAAPVVEPARLKTRLDAVLPEFDPTPAAPNARHGLGYGPMPMTQMAPAALVQVPVQQAGPVQQPGPQPVLAPPGLPEPKMRPASAPTRAETKLPEAAIPIPVPMKKRRGSLVSRATFFLRPPWRGLFFKLGVGAAVASLAVAYQNQLQPTAPAKQAVPRPAAPNPPPKQTVALPSALPTPKLDPRIVATLTAHRGSIVALAVHPIGRRIVTVGMDGQVRISDIDTGSLTRAFSLTAPSPAIPATGIPTVAPMAPLSPPVAAAIQGNQIVTAHNDGSVALWDLDKGERIASTRRLDGAVSAVAFTSETDRIAVAGVDGKLMLLDRKSASSAPLVAGDGHREAITALAYVGERNGLLTASADKTVKSWNAETLSRRRTHTGHRDTVTALDAAGDGKSFASGSDDGQVRLWSTLSSSVRRTLRAHEMKVTTLAHSPVGDLLASGAADGVVKLWELKSGKELAMIVTRAGAVRAMGFTPDARRLVIASDDGSVKIWDVAGLRVARSE